MWHREDSSSVSKSNLESLLNDLKTDRLNGLSETDASSRLQTYGPNVIVERKEQSFLSLLLKELREPMILLLVVIGVIYSLIGNPTDSVVIIVIVFLVVFLETYNVNRARKSMNALKELTKPTANVVREGKARKEKSQNLVPGDILLINAGERIPADGRLLDSYGLKVDESSLTGESFSVLKEAESLPASSQLAELTNMVFSSTLVVQGNGKFVATSTGKNTEIGKISELLQETEETPTPFEQSLSRLTVAMAMVAIGFSTLIPIVGFLQGHNVYNMLLTGLSMAFATIPEELPVLISITLAVGAYSLSKHKAVVKNLKGAETLGSVTVIATDKTGTLTENRMTVSNLYNILGNGKIVENGSKDLAIEAVLATGTLMLERHERPSYKDPMEVAVFEYTQHHGLELGAMKERYRIIDEFSFDNNIKLSSFLYAQDSTLALFVSGAPEVILARSEQFMDERGQRQNLDDSTTKEILRKVDEVAGRGERTIAIASRIVPNRSEDRNVLEQKLTFHGLVSFIDPPRKEVRKAINDCQEAGIRVIMLTGDHPNTARSIARTVGINSVGRVITGKEMSLMDDNTLSSELDGVSIFARITSEDKFRIVRLLKEKGETVAVTGDGVNDSPALNLAEIGIAMGIRGTEVAREASDMVLMDDNFSTIVEAVRQGRGIHYTLRKSIKYELTIKISLVLILLLPLILLIPFPFSPIQIIIVELLMDVAALGGFIYEREEDGLMKRPPRRNGSHFFDSPMILNIAISSLLMTIAVSGVYVYLVYTSGMLIRAQTAAFATWILSQVFLAQNLRTEYEPVFVKGFFSNRVIVIWGVAVVLSLVLITIFPSLQIVLHTYYLTSLDWILIAIGSAASTFWMEAIKFIRYSRYGKRHTGKEQRAN